jgi:hypothetical protein
MERVLGLVLMLAIAGCSTTAVRLPSCQPRPPEAEAKSYTWHDPFPDEEIGPKTFSRPRTFTEPRTESMKNYVARNQRAAYGFPLPSFGWNPNPNSAMQYPYQPIWQAQPLGTPVSAIPAWTY